MVLLTTTPRILKAISSLSLRDRASLNSLPSTTDTPIDHKTVIALSRLSSDFHLNSLLRGTSVYTPPPPPKPQPSPEYVALMERLRREQEQREYRILVTKDGDGLGDHGPEEKDDISPSLVLNILLSIIMCAGATFYITRWWNNDGVRVLLSLLVGLVVGVAEVTVYASYLRKVKASRDKEQAKKERKEFIGEYQGPEDEVLSSKTELTTTTSEKEEIWGRGVNGGMRRRVREKWEKDHRGIGPT